MSLLKIPYRHAVDRHYDVVTCFSPLFFFEKWQPLVAALELYKHFGASLQMFYVESMLEEILRFLRVSQCLSESL